MATASGPSVCAALGSGDQKALMEISQEVAKLSDKERLQIVSALPANETWAAHFAAAACQWRQQRGFIWAVLQIMTDIRPPPLQHFMAQFGNAELISELISTLSSSEPDESRRLACNCIRNLGRIPRIRGMLEVSIEPLVDSLSGSSSELAGAVAAALCNVSCTIAGQEKAVTAGAVPKLLLSLSKESNTDVADDVVASLGVLTGSYPGGAEAVVESELGVIPITRCLGLGCPTPAATALEVLCDLTLASGPTGSVASQLAADTILVTEQVPQLLRRSEPPIRGSVLKLCALLLEQEGFRVSFAKGGGIQALQASLELEPPAPPAGLFQRPGKLQICQTGCAEQCCFSPGSGLLPRKPPSRREIAEQLLSQLSKSL
eukprot:TRINITY_DN27689_c0_g1_i1.p1 TRINITY_DN27689_c0_g1~~TRINITY_DN27689_c0_g1_i1.p1  ORF type:complete len:389 (-),score=82.59 TRINITY_DN27689_c0_g1_i1:197-1324(-)